MNRKILLSAFILVLSGFLLLVGVEMINNRQILIIWYSIDITVFIASLFFLIYNICLETREETETPTIPTPSEAFQETFPTPSAPPFPNIY